MFPKTYIVPVNIATTTQRKSKKWASNIQKQQKNISMGLKVYKTANKKKHSDWLYTT